MYWGEFILIRYSVGIAAAMALSTPTVHAQSGWVNMIPLDLGTSDIAARALDQPINDVMNEAARGEDGGASALPQARSATSTTVLRFTPSTQRRSANLAGFVDRVRATDPAGARDLQQLLGSTDVIGQIGRALAPMGLQTDNLADAYTVYWITAWDIAQGQDSNPSPTQMQAVKRQAETAMLAVPQLAGASDANKQQAAEAFLVQAAMMQGMFDSATDAEQRQQLASAVRQGASASGVDLDAMQLTPDGFVKR